MPTIKRPPKAEIQEAYKSATSVQACADSYGVSFSTLYKWLRHYKIPTSRIGGENSWNCKLTDEDCRLLMQLRGSMTAEEAGEKFECSYRTVIDIWNGHTRKMATAFVNYDETPVDPNTWTKRCPESGRYVA